MLWQKKLLVLKRPAMIMQIAFVHKCKDMKNTFNSFAYAWSKRVTNSGVLSGTVQWELQLAGVHTAMLHSWSRTEERFA